MPSSSRPIRLSRAPTAVNLTSRPDFDDETRPVSSKIARCLAMACRETGNSAASADADASSVYFMQQRGDACAYFTQDETEE